MFDKRIILAAAGLFLAGAVAVCAIHYQRPKRSNRIDEQWQTTNGTVDIRVTEYGEDNAGMDAGAYYAFESKRTGTNEWHEFMTFRHDDPVPIPREQIRFAGDRISYVFMGWTCAVTTDSGSTWSTWTAEKDLPNWHAATTA